jgi:hypothetical protein
VVWGQDDAVRANIWANRYVIGTGWGTAELIETDNAGDAFGVQIGSDPSGNAIAVWHRLDGARADVFANYYTVGRGWGTPELIETESVNSAGAPKIAVDVNGDATVVFVVVNGSIANLWANRYLVGTGWGTPELIEIRNLGIASLAQVAVDSSGVVIAVWEQHDGVINNIWANRYIPGLGWGNAQLIETNNDGLARRCQVAMDVSGNAVAVWEQSDGSRYNIWANHYLVQ